MRKSVLANPQRAWLLAISTAVLSACVSGPVIVEKPASTSIEPIPRPQWSVGMKRQMTDVRNGQQKGYEIAELLPQGKLRKISLEPLAGPPCTWTGSIELFAPAESWRNCGGTGEWNTGTQSVELVSGGSLWPLTPGAKAEYRYIPVSSHGSRGTPETRKCEVIGPVAIEVSLGEFDAMKVQCTTQRWDGAVESRIWYWTAEYGDIKFMRVQSFEGIKQDQELTTLNNY